MRTLPAAMAEIITEGEFTGTTKVVHRATITSAYLGIYEIPGIGKGGPQTYSSILFSTSADYGKELPNLKSVSWERSVDVEVASCTIELYNTKPLPPGQGPETGEAFDQLGYYSYNRGRTSYSQSTWGHKSNEWRHRLVPDKLVRTYEGYGEANYDVAPEHDPSVVLTGIWLIDEVTYTADGLITLEMRDLGRLLIDQVCFLPVVPKHHYPLQFVQRHEHLTEPILLGPGGSYALNPQYSNDSNAVYYGPNADIHGHYGVDAYDGDEFTYWLSVGNATSSSSDSFEWLEGKLEGKQVTGIRCHVWAGPYRVYLSVESDGQWVGSSNIPYSPDGRRDNGSSIPFVREGVVPKDGIAVFMVNFPNVTRVRVTFTDLYDSGVGGTHRYRAGVRALSVLAAGTTTGDPSPVVADGVYVTSGNYVDFSEVVKRLLAYGGFYWPQNGRIHGTNHQPPGQPRVLNKRDYSFSEPDPYLSTEDGDARLFRLLDEVKQGRTYDDIRRSVDIIKYGNTTQHFEPLPTDPAQDAPHYPAPFGPATDADARARITSIFTNRAVSMDTPSGKGRIWGDIKMAGSPGRAGRVQRIVEQVQGGFRTFDSVRASVDFIKYGNWEQHFEPLPTPPGTDAAYVTKDEIRTRVLQIFANREVDTEDSDGRVDLTPDIFDQKPLLDGVSYIRDLLGFIFYIDENGAAQFRPPNIHKLGNWRTDVNGLGAERTLSHAVLRDDEAILGLRAKLSSRNLSNLVLVATKSGERAGLAKGREPNPSSFRRVGVWSNSQFAGNEVQVEADLIQLRKLFTYRQDTIRIPANPAIQVDDQVQILERATGEAYMHYVRSIKSSWDQESGKWVYDLTTSWLGEDPEGEWAFTTTDLAKETQEFLDALGIAPGSATTTTVVDS